MEAGRQPQGGGHTIAALIGGILALLATCLVVAGASLLWLDGERDSDGYFTTGPHAVSSPTFAISSESLELVEDAPRWLFNQERLGTIRIRAIDAERPLFVGIAGTASVLRFLNDVPHEVATGVGTDPFDVATRQAIGSRAPGPPVNANLWVASTVVEGTGEVEWDVTPGDWAVVVMNADGSAGIDARLELGAKVGFLVPVGVAFTVGGALLLMVGLGSIVFALLSRPVETGISAPSAKGVPGRELEAFRGRRF